MNLLTKEFIVVAIGGALGSMSRFGLSRWVQMISHHKDYPWGIFVVNVLGCLLMGILFGLFVHRFALGPLWRAGILIGFLGGFTTFSSFSMDTIHLLQIGDIISAMSNMLLTLFCCLLATAGGLLITRALMQH